MQPDPESLPLLVRTHLIALASKSLGGLLVGGKSRVIGGLAALGATFGFSPAASATIVPGGTPAEIKPGETEEAATNKPGRSITPECNLEGAAVVCRSTYDVTSTGATKADFREFAYTVDAILSDPRGWSLSGSVRFERVTSGGQFTVRLAAADVVGSYDGCDSRYSCRSGRYVLINDNRWRFATPSFRGTPLHTYRQMAVNHEVGHALGFGHANCRRVGRLAPVMQQQSMGLQGCLPNPWPLPSERRSLARRLGVRVKPMPPGIEVGERIGPVDLQADTEQVLGRLGAPARERRRNDTSALLHYRADRLDILLLDGRVARVSTTSSKFRTRNGIGVGSTRRQVRRQLKRAACDATACVIGRADPSGDASTTFVLNDGRVAKVRLERLTENPERPPA